MRRKKSLFCVFLIPDVCAFLFKRFDYARINSCINKNFMSALLHKDSNWNAPGPLTRHHPIGTIRYHAPNAIFSSGRGPLRTRNFIQRKLTKRLPIGKWFIHCDEPLWRISKNDWFFRAPRMGILMLQSSPGDDGANSSKRCNHSLIRIPLVAFFCDHPFVSKAWRFLSVKTVFINSIRDIGLNTARDQITLARHPNIKIFSTMTWRSMHKTCANIICYMVAIKHWHIKVIAKMRERVCAYKFCKLSGRHRPHTLIAINFCSFKRVICKLISKNKTIANPRPIIFCRLGNAK